MSKSHIKAVFVFLIEFEIENVSRDFLMGGDFEVKCQ